MPRQTPRKKPTSAPRGQVLKFGRLSFNQCPGRALGRGQRRPTAPDVDVRPDPNDAATLSRVRELLGKLAADPANGIDRVLEADELHKHGGFPGASFFLGLKPGWRTGSTLEGPVLSKTKIGGAHGELPDLPDLRAAFFLIGPGITAGRSLDLIDMRDVAPTLAHAIGLALPSASGKNLLP